MGKLESNGWMYLAEQSGQGGQLADQALVHYSPRHAEMGMTYQQLAYGLVRTLRTLNPVVVETGVNSGLSTFYILAALADRVDGGALISCDPQYKSQDDATGRVGNVDLRSYWKGKVGLFKNWHFFSGKSRHVLDAIVEKFPEWDVFVHDSDHSQENMRYEIEFAWKHLKPGGYLIIDDPHGTDEAGTHDETTKFLAKHPEVDWAYLDQAIVCRKPEEASRTDGLGGSADVNYENLNMPPFGGPVRVPLDELAKIDPAANLDPEAAEEAALTAQLAAQEATLAASLAANPPPPLPVVAEEVFEQPEENEKTDEDAELDAIIGAGEDDDEEDGEDEDGDDGEGEKGDDDDEPEDSKGRQ